MFATWAGGRAGLQLGQVAIVADVYTKTDTYSKTEVNQQIANLVDSAPSTLNTLNELASALGDDKTFQQP